MKRYHDLYPTLTSFENLWLAARKAARGKRGQPAVAAFDFNLEDELLRLQDELIAETYQPGPYTSFYIRDPKHRLISAAPFSMPTASAWSAKWAGCWAAGRSRWGRTQVRSNVRSSDFSRTLAADD